MNSDLFSFICYQIFFFTHEIRREARSARQTINARMQCAFVWIYSKLPCNEHLNFFSSKKEKNCKFQSDRHQVIVQRDWFVPTIHIITIIVVGVTSVPAENGDRANQIYNSICCAVYFWVCVYYNFISHSNKLLDKSSVINRAFDKQNQQKRVFHEKYC